MNIIGPDSLVFGVDDVDACTQYLTDYGLAPVGNGRFEALDGTGVVLARKDDPGLPAPLPTATMLRKTVYGVADAATLEAIAAELQRDREVRRLADGSIESVDDSGFVLGFQVSVRKPLDLPAESVNAPGAPPQRPPNVAGADQNARRCHARSRTSFTSFPMRPRPKRSTSAWASSRRTASSASALSCGPRARWTTTRSS